MYNILQEYYNKNLYFIKMRNKAKYVIGKFFIIVKLYIYQILARFTSKFIDKQNRLLQIYDTYYTESGRIKLANGMIEPIRRALDYQGIGRRLLMVDSLTEGAYSRYQGATNEEIRRVQSQLARTLNDPNLTIVMGLPLTQEDIVNLYSGTEAEHIDIDREEVVLCNYLSWISNIKEEKKLNDCRKLVQNSITELKIEE